MESVINQSYKNWEYFVCNHGSKDNTLAIMREYEAKDSRIKVIDMPNSARGFYPDMIKEKGRGKYFAMLDSDDYWHKDNLSKLVIFSELNNLDMTVCAIDYFKDDQKEFKRLRKCEKAYCYNIEDNKYYWSFMYAFLRTTWGKVIRMECLREADFSAYKINAQDFISDDTAFTLANYEKCKRIGSIPDVLLYYRITEGSVTAKYRPKMIDNNENIYYQQLKVLENIGDNTQKSRDHAIAVFWRAMYDASVSLFKTDLGDEEKIHEIWKMCQLKASNELVSMRYTDCTETMRLCMSYVEYLKDKIDTLGNESIKKLQDINVYFDKFKSTRISNT
jgi:glycosyltransferase involved in cell wall biosynthesis